MNINIVTTPEQDEALIARGINLETLIQEQLQKIMIEYLKIKFNIYVDKVVNFKDTSIIRTAITDLKDAIERADIAIGSKL